ncbi:hypothetical protein NE236_11160 [Actinoallomurus purpureus]|uniref:hypothetical protein n=1 Tax=Actinoallomurus purpureus TaxID=478114 RepID=UPI0020931F85|nr:hypothetical protein [Actinoallomurus purpureus]MCO6005539.1 hypothetical protein [Actinoallomurus purpureus]
MNTTRISFVAAPALIGAYGVARLIDRTSRFGWTFGHLLMLAGLVLFALVIVGLRRAAPGRTATAFAGIGLIGLAASIAQIGIDIVVGLLARDAADKEHMFDQIQQVPGVMPVVYTIVPILFYVGLLGLTVVAAVVNPRVVPWWTPVLILAGTVAAAASLDYIPAAGVLYVLALTSPAVRRPHRATHAIA